MTKLTEKLRELQANIMEDRRAWRHGDRQKYATAHDIVEYKIPNLCIGVKILCDLIDMQRVLTENAEQQMRAKLEEK